MLRSILTKKAPKPVTAIITGKSGVLTKNSPTIHRIWQPSWSQANLSATLPLAINYRQEKPFNFLDMALDAYINSANISLPRGNPMSTYRFSVSTPLSGNVWHRGREYELALKGAPEAVFMRCDLTESEREEAYKMVATLAADGCQVVAVARSVLPEAPANLRMLPAHEKLTFAGLVASSDTLHPKARQAVKDALKASISIRMVTGDHPEAAFFVGRRLGLVSRRSQILDSRTLRYMSSEEQEATIRQTPIFARAAPRDKRLITTMLEKHYTVAVADTFANSLPSLFDRLRK